ncbi:hypothetical protein ACF0H5_014747 [Mactra antiquata]
MEGEELTKDAIEYQKTEINEVKATFPGKVKVISGVGDFTHVVTITPEGQNIHCKFQLTEKYPHTPPVISIQSECMYADLTTSLASHLQKEASNNTLLGLMTSCRQWLLDNDVDVSFKPDTKKEGSKKRSGKNNKSKKAVHKEDDDSFKKKPPMKTAADVIKRIQWDENVNKDDFIVGYMDRIVGLVEKSFSAFTWEDLASVDMFALAIPQHRIQYFKYKTEKVWDKNDRLDNVFGSTGSKITIVDAIKSYEDKIKQQKHVSDNAEGQKIVTVENEKTQETEAAENEENQQKETVENGCEAGIDQTIVDTIPEKDIDTDMASRRQSFRPNYFTAIQLTDQDTVRNLVSIQDAILTRHPKYEPYRIQPNGFHLTLNVLLLDSSRDVDVCVDAMKKVSSDLKDLMLATKPLVFEGVDNFDTCKVIFAKVGFSQEFLSLVDKINQTMNDSGLRVDMKSLKPHVTLFNVSWSTFKSMDWKKENIMLNDYATFKFGSQPVNNVQVCRMGTLPTGHGFYRSIFKLNC